MNDRPTSECCEFQYDESVRSYGAGERQKGSSTGLVRLVSKNKSVRAYVDDVLRRWTTYDCSCCVLLLSHFVSSSVRSAVVIVIEVIAERIR